MNYALAIRVLPEPVRSLAFGSISGTYAAIGTAFANPIRIIFIQNLTDKSLMFSFDGTNDHFPLVAEAFLLLDVTSNSSVSQGFFLAQGTKMYVKDLGSAATIGDVYVSVFYGTAAP